MSITSSAAAMPLRYTRSPSRMRGGRGIVIQAIEQPGAPYAWVVSIFARDKRDTRDASTKSLFLCVTLSILGVTLAPQYLGDTRDTICPVTSSQGLKHFWCSAQAAYSSPSVWRW